MALVVFSQEAGQVTAFADPSFPGQISLKLDGWEGAARMKAIITRANLSAACNFQLMHALGGDAYLYVFGDRVGQSTLSGLAFETFCGEGNGTIGIENVAKYYRQNRLSARETPIKITIGGSLAIKGYLAAINTDVEDAATRIWRFALSFLEPPDVLPKRKKANNDAADGAPAGGDFVGGEGGSSDPVDSGESEGGTFPITITDPGGLRTDSGGYDPDAGPSPLAAGSGYSAYNSGPNSPTAFPFQVP